MRTLDENASIATAPAQQEGEKIIFQKTAHFESIFHRRRTTIGLANNANGADGMQMQQFFAKLFGYKAWANREIFATLAAQPDGAQSAPIVRILNHVYVVDAIFQAHLQGVPHGYTALNTPATPRIAVLREGVARLDQWYADHVAAVSDAALAATVAFQFVDGSMGQMSGSDILFHVVNHGSYHRGAAGNMLAQTGIAPPKDVFTNFRPD
jgi:uncharacterized damage-inducible protein DinB